MVAVSHFSSLSLYAIPRSPTHPSLTPSPTPSLRCLEHHLCVYIAVFTIHFICTVYIPPLLHIYHKKKGWGYVSGRCSGGNK